MTTETYLNLADDLREPDKCQMHTLIEADRHKIVRALEIMATDPQRPDFGACVTQDFTLSGHLCLTLWQRLYPID